MTLGMPVDFDFRSACRRDRTISYSPAFRPNVIIVIRRWSSTFSGPTLASSFL